MNTLGRFGLIINNIAEGICVHEFVRDVSDRIIDYRIVEINSAYEEILGIRGEDARHALGSDLYEQSPPPFLDTYREAFLKNEETEFSVFFEPMKKHFRIKVLPEKPNGFITIFSDITEEVQKTERVNSLERYLGLAVRTAKIGIWELDLKTNELFWDERMSEMYGFDSEQSEDVLQKWRDVIHSDDKAKIEKQVKEAREGKTEFNTEYRIITPSGEIRFLRSFASIVRNANGDAVKMVGATYNISRLKNLISEFRESEMKFRTLADTTPVAIMLYQDDYWVYVNPAAEKISGYSESELLKMKFWEFVHPDDQEIVKNRGKARQREEYAQENYEFRIVCGNGEIKYVNLTGAIVEYEGKPAGLITVVDVDKRRKAEIAVKSNYEELTRITENIPNAIWKSDIDENGKFHNTYISENMNNMLGLPFGFLGNSWDKYFERVKPEYLAGIEEKFLERFTNPGKTIGFEYEVQKADGSYIWVVSYGRAYVYNGKMQAYGYTSDISERKRQEYNMHLKERAIQASVDGIAVLNNENSYVFMNPAVARIYGYDSPEQLMNFDWTQFYENQEAERIEGDVFPEFLKKGYWRGEATGKRKDGSTFSQELSLTKLPDGGMVSIVRDVSVRKDIESALKESERNLQAVLNNTHQLFILLDKKYNIVTINSVAKAYYEKFMDAEVKPGHNILSFFDPAFKRKFKANFERALQGEHLTSEQEAKLNGVDHWFSTTYHPVVNDNNVVQNVVISILDITESRKFEAELIEARERAEESDRLKSSFLANMSHEIRTPMNGILGFANLLKTPDLSEEEQHQYLEVINRSGNRMLNIINDLVEISKIESGQLSVDIQKVNVGEVLEELHVFFSAEAKAKNLKLELDSECTVMNCTIHTDKQKITQVMTNLIKNAIKFTDSGSVTFGCRCLPDEILFFVKDTGMGIPLDMQEIIFDRFRQIENEYTKMIEGTGLGLSISKAYVDILNGNIWCDSDLGKGTEFYFTIPGNGDVAKKQKPSDVQNENKPTSILPQLRILLAEDDPGSVSLYKNYVKNLDIEILVAKNGFEALTILDADRDIDLIILDVKMPLKNGFEVLNEISEKYRDIPVIMQSAFASAADKQKALDEGCVEYLTKPLTKTKLLAAIANHTT